MLLAIFYFSDVVKFAMAASVTRVVLILRKEGLFEDVRNLKMVSASFLVVIFFVSRSCVYLGK